MSGSISRLYHIAHVKQPNCLSVVLVHWWELYSIFDIAKFYTGKSGFPDMLYACTADIAARLQLFATNFAASCFEIMKFLDNNVVWLKKKQK